MSIYIQHTKAWIKNFVIKLNLCPFASSVFEEGKILFTLEEQEDVISQLIAFWNTVQLLKNHNLQTTAIIIYPNGPTDFQSFLDLFDKAEKLLTETSLSEDYQLAGFHPDYEFADSMPSDPADYTNRSPYPSIHILNVGEVESAILSHPNITSVPKQNQKTLRKLGIDEIKKLIANTVL